MEISKFFFRFRQFGGFRLIRVYIQKGALSIVVKELWRVLVHGLPLKEAYPKLRSFVSPILREEYMPLLHELSEKYKDVELEHKKNDVVWFCWLQGVVNAPDMVKLCYETQKRFIKDKTFVEISDSNYKQYVNLPGYIIEKYEKKIIPAPHFSDLLRLELLIEHGGTWIDSTVLCTGDYPPEILDCELCFFQFFRKGSIHTNGISNWFISAYSNNKLLIILRDMLYRYWQDYDCVLNYHIFHLFFSMISELYPTEIAAMPRQNSYAALALGIRLKEDYDEEWQNRLKSVCSFHKLTYRITKTMVNNKNSFYNHIIEEHGN